jgi:LuxR family maltose regulon positive regulatory protein
MGSRRDTIPSTYDPPEIRGPQVRRGRRVFDALDEERGAAVLCLRAPAGYGKTTLLAQWVADDTRPTVWLHVPPAAADAHWVVHQLVDALAGAGGFSGQVRLPSSSDPATWHLDTLPSLERLLASVPMPVVVVVDNADLLRGEAWDSLLDALVRSLPEGSQLALALRGDLPGALWRLHGQGQVALLGPDVLAFDVDGVARLIGGLGMPATPQLVDRIMAATQGWPIAVYLAARAARTAPPESLRSVTDIAGLSEYLREDVVSRLPGDDARFLSRVCVVPDLTPEACDRLAGTDDAALRLRRLSSEYQLLTAAQASGDAYRIHPLLVDFLERELRTTDPQGWAEAHRVASEVEEARGDLDSAVHHAKQAGDDDRLADLVWGHTAVELGRGRRAVVSRWLSGLSEDRLGARGGLALAAAWEATESGDMARVGRLALAAAGLVEEGTTPDGLDLGLLEATIGADGLAAIETLTSAFIESKKRDDRWQTLAHFLLGVSLLFRDDPEGAVRAFDEGYRLCVVLDVPLIMGHCLAGRANAALHTGDEHKAVSCIRELRELVVVHRLDAVASSAPMLTASTQGYVLEGRHADARHEAARALRMTAMMRGITPWHAVHGRLTLAQAYLALGDPARAAVLLEEAGDERGPATASPVLDRLYDETRDRLEAASATLDGAAALTTAEIRVLQYLPGHLSFPQIADELFLSRHTVKTQALSAYRKLGVHTRSEAIVRARRARLLPPG